MTPRAVTELLGEIAVIALTVVVTISFERLFLDTSFLGDLLVMVVGSHLVAIGCRRAALSMLWSTTASGVALVVLGTAVFYPETATLALPTRETLSVLGDDLRAAWTTFSEDAAPVPPMPGFLVVAAVAMWYGAFLADWAAFRLRSPFETITPATAAFVFVALLGTDRNQVAHGIAYAAAMAAVLLTLRAARQVREEVWVGVGTGAGMRTTLRLGTTAGVVAVLAGGVLGPSLPGSDAPPLIDVTEIDDGPGTRRVVSPLVEVAASLVEQSNAEFFSVKVDPADRDYWRLMALTTFDGSIWRRSSNFEDVRGPVESDIDPSVPRRTVRQEITMKSLDNIYLPAAYEVTDVIDSGGAELEYEVATGALVIARDSEGDVGRGFTYVVESAVPDYDPAQLPARATEGLDGGFVDEHTQLPPTCGAGESAAENDCWPERANELARQVTAGATTDFERVRLLQQHFLEPLNYDYDIDVALRHSVRDVEDFLFEVRRGYCEQFSSVFAAMARSLGIPARVAVGFTWGDWDADRQEYVVKGQHAHAWPEVYFAGVGWVVLDPTPGRNRPHDSDITGIAEPQQYPANQLGTVPPTTVTLDLDPTDPDNTVPPPRPTAPDFEFAPDDGGDGGDGRIPTGVRILLGIIVAVVLLVAAIPTTRTVQRRRRLSRVAADAVGRGELAWDDAVAALALVHLHPEPEDTLLEFCSRLGRSRLNVGPIEELAHHLTRLRYAALDDDAAVIHARGAQEAAAAVVETCRRLAGKRTVLRAQIDPRTLVRRH